MYEGEPGPRFEIRPKEHAKGEEDRTRNPLYAKHFIEMGHAFINLCENIEILKIEYNIRNKNCSKS